MSANVGAPRVTLIAASADWRERLLPMAQEFVDVGEPGGRGADSPWRLALDDFGAYIAAIEDARATPLSGFVAMTTYWLVAGGELVGQSRLRHELNDDLRIEGGHIGYGIRPSERRKRYGSLALELTLQMARARGLERVLITCDDDNVASRKIIGRSGGLFEGAEKSPRSGNLVNRYWISL